jgi:flagellar biosynthesis protein FlhB
LVEWKSALTLSIVTFLAVFIVFAILDLWYSKRDFAKQMRMSTRDIKDEYKRREGDPEIKHKRKKGMQQLMRNVMGLSQMKNADVIITNPTHVAVALQYRPNSMALPTVLVKGKGFLAKIIMRRASMMSIPIMRVPVLARTLYKECEVNNPIPLDQQINVAKIYRELIKMPGSKVFSDA